MSNNEEKSNGLVQAENSKQTIRNYVRTVKELQMKKLILENANEKMLVQSQKQQDEMNNTLISKQKELEKNNANYLKCKENYEYARDEKYVGIGERIITAVILMLISAALIFGILYVIAWPLKLLFGPLLGGLGNLIHSNLAIVGIISAIIGTIIAISYILWDLPQTKKNWTKQHMIWLDDCKFKMESAERIARSLAMQVDEISNQDIPNAKQLFDKQIENNESAINVLNENLQLILDANIIPPAYRDIDCVITLDHIFENDLADHMREAVLLYREWLAQERIIAGLENIYKMLGQLSSQMQYMQLTLESIDSSVNSICSDMGKLVTLQKQNNKTQEQILRESESTRVATEAVRRSNEKYEWYVEQHRQGLL